MNDNISRPTKQQKSDFEWFKANRAELFSEYGNCVIVISNKHVIAKSDDYVTIAKEVMKKYEAGTFIVQWLSDSDSCYKAWVGGAQVDKEVVWS